MKQLKYFVLAASLAVTACQKDEADPVVDPEEPEEITCEQSTCWDASLYACRDSVYIKLFTRNKGWTGGDATYSVDLMNGKTLWMFGDSFIDQVSEDRSRPTFRLINNSLVLQEGSKMTTFHGGTAANPQAFANHLRPEIGIGRVTVPLRMERSIFSCTDSARVAVVPGISFELRLIS